MRFKILVFLLSGVMLGMSCKKSFLEPEAYNSIAAADAYQTENDISLAVNGVYQLLRSGDAVGEGALTWTDDRSDDINTTDNQSNNGEPFQFTAFALSPSNTWLYNHWVALYRPISEANMILSRIDDVTFASETTKNQYKAEMRFVRAFMYFNLVREFGDVPMVTERLSNPEEALKLTERKPRVDVYGQIIADLRAAVESELPVVQPASQKGRPSLQAANGLLGKVYLTMAASGVDPDNKNAHLESAKTYLLACYNQRTFDKLSDIPFADVFDVNKEQTNPEIIWQISYKQGDPTYSSSIARTNQARGETINSLAVSTGTGRLISADLRKEFEVGDVRTDFSIQYAEHSSVQDYFVSKFRDASEAAGALGYGGNDWILLRYADIILCLAEVAMLQGDEVGAISYMDMVRARAGRPSYALMLNDPEYASRYPTLKLAILHERRVELAFEHHRWHDLVRFFNATELVNYFQRKSQADYNNSPLSNISEKDYYFPIPLNETRIDPKRMYQNPGYSS